MHCIELERGYYHVTSVQLVSIMGDTVRSMSIDLGFKSVVSNRYYTVLTVGRWAWWLLSVMKCVKTYLSKSFVQKIEEFCSIPSHFPFRVGFAQRSSP